MLCLSNGRNAIKAEMGRTVKHSVRDINSLLKYLLSVRVSLLRILVRGICRERNIKPIRRKKHHPAQITVFMSVIPSFILSGQENSGIAS